MSRFRVYGHARFSSKRWRSVVWLFETHGYEKGLRLWMRRQVEKKLENRT